jgi:hypothetical protein
VVLTIAQKVLHAGRQALVGDRGDVDVVLDLEQLGQEVRPRAVARVEVVELARVGLRVGHELGQAIGGRGGRHAEQGGAHAHHGDGLEVGHDVEWCLHQEGQRDMTRYGEIERVAVGRGAEEHLSRHDAVGARPRIDQPALPEFLLHGLADGAAGDVDQPARRPGQDHPDRLGRPGLGPCRERRRQRRAQQHSSRQHPIYAAR